MRPVSGATIIHKSLHSGATVSYEIAESDDTQLCDPRHFFAREAVIA